jgi:hypothetical protein
MYVLILNFLRKLKSGGLEQKCVVMFWLFLLKKKLFLVRIVSIGFTKAA